jgi:hypothetical protein
MTWSTLGQSTEMRERKDPERRVKKEWRKKTYLQQEKQEK